MILLVVGGFFRSLQFTAINTLAYAEVEPAQMSRATTLVSVNQQLAVSAGVAVGAFSVESTMWFASCDRTERGLFRAGVHRGVDHLDDFGLFLLPDARRCRPSDFRTRRRRDLLPGARRRTGGNRRRPRPPTRGISGWDRRRYCFATGISPAFKIADAASGDARKRSSALAASGCRTVLVSAPAKVNIGWTSAGIRADEGNTGDMYQLG